MNRFKQLMDTFGIGTILLVLCIIFAFQSKDFFSATNFSSILIQTSVNIIIATGMTFVISAAEIDLSVGSLLALCGMITALSLKIDPETGQNLPMAVAYLAALPFGSSGISIWVWWVVAGIIFMLCTLVPGVLLGSTVGLMVVCFRVPSFIVTLGFMMIYRGFARYLTNAAPVTGMPLQFMQVGSGTWFNFYDFRITYSSVIALVVVMTGFFLFNRSRFGRHVLALGGNAQASYLSGVPIHRTRMAVFALSGLCVGIAAIVQTSRLFIGDPNAGEGYELDAIAAVIIGGTSLFGGQGTVIGTCFGALIIGVLRNGLDFMNVTDHMKQIVIGSMIIFAVLLDYYRQRIYRTV